MQNIVHRSTFSIVISCDLNVYSTTDYTLAEL